MPYCGLSIGRTKAARLYGIIILLDLVVDEQNELPSKQTLEVLKAQERIGFSLAELIWTRAYCQTQPAVANLIQDHSVTFM